MSNRKADNLLLFKSIVDCGSLSTAAKTCNISVSQASKRMTHLEYTLGIQLLYRSTRKLALTPPGEILHKKLEAIKDQIDEAWQSMLEYTSEPKGEVQISSPIYFGLRNLVTFTQEFSNQHPQIQIDLKLINEEQPPEETNYDIQFMSHVMGPNELIPDSSCCAKKVHSEKLVYVASRSYLEQHGTPNHPEELQQHKCLAINNSNNGKKHWTFYDGQTPFKQVVDVAFATNTYEALFSASQAGMGIALIPMGLLEQNNTDMIVLFEEFSQETLDTYAYYIKNKITSKKVSLILENLTEQKT